MPSKKTIRFYAAVWIGEDDTPDEVARDFPADEVHRILGSLADDHVRQDAGLGRYHLAETYTVQPPRTPLALYRVSAEDLPMLYDTDTGDIRPLDEVLGTESLDVAEPTYFTFFPDGVLGFVYNHHGPKPRDLERYIQDKVDMASFEFRPLPRLDVLQTLEAAGEAKVFDIRVPVEFGDAFEGTPLENAAAFGQAMNSTTIEVVLRAKNPAHRDSMARRVSEFVSQMRPSQKESLEALRVHLGADEDYKGDRALDLLDEHLVIETQIDTVTGRRYLDRDDALGHLHDAHESLGGAIAHGLEAMLEPPS